MGKKEQLELDLLGLADESVALWFSAGKDSLLLYEALKALKVPFAVVRFDHGWTKEQKKVVTDRTEANDDVVYCYPPTAAMLVGDGNQLTMGASYAVGNGGQFLLLRDLVDGERCAHDLKVEYAGSFRAPIYWSTIILGTKASDSHFAVGQLCHAKEWEDHGQRFLAPLYDWSDAEVIEALREFDIDYEEPPDHLNTGNVVTCPCFRNAVDGPGRCKKTGKEIPQWDPKGNLQILQELVGVM